MNKWEYKVIFADYHATDESDPNVLNLTDKDTFETELNELGDKGWELIEFETTTDEYGWIKTGWAIFKRIKIEE